MKKIVVLSLILLGLVGCNNVAEEVVEKQPTTVTIGQTTEVIYKNTSSEFGGITVEQVDKREFAQDIKLDDRDFVDIIARAFYVSILDAKFNGSLEYDAPSLSFIIDDMVKTPYVVGKKTFTYDLEKQKVSFDDASSIIKGFKVNPLVLDHSMPIVKYSYLINGIVEAELVITKKIGYPGDNITYSTSFVLTTVRTSDYITTTVVSRESCDINEAVYLSVFSNEPINTMNLLTDLVDESYLTDSSFNEVIKYKARLNENILDQVSTVSLSEGDNPFYYNTCFVSSQEASLIQKMLSDGYKDDYESSTYETFEEYTMPNQTKIVKLNENIGIGDQVNYELLNRIGIDSVSSQAPFNLYGSIAHISDTIELMLYCDEVNEKKYLIATTEGESFVVEYEDSEKSKILMYLFDLLGETLS
jgi:hypothetical protein